jgi:hypothetical protein
MDASRIVPKIGVGFSRWPSKIEVLLTSAGEAETTITLNGSIGGVGPLQKRHLTGELNKLRNAIEVAVRTAPTRPSSAAASAMTEGDAASASTADGLRHIADLYERGLLTEAEFEAAKAKLLG